MMGYSARRDGGRGEGKGIQWVVRKVQACSNFDVGTV